MCCSGVRIAAVLVALVPMSSFTQDRQRPISDLKSDERVVFFTTDARQTADQSQWIVPIHAWVHELDRASIRRASVAASLNAKYGIKVTEQTKANFDRRVRLLIADNERGKVIAIEIAGKQISLPPTEENGHAFVELTIDADLVRARAEGSVLRYRALLDQDDDRSYFGQVNLIESSGISVISDLDDTVKITEVTDRAKMLENSLLLDFQPVDAMASKYSHWAESGTALHFVSSSPWHLYEPIDEFLDAHGFPARSLALKHFRFKDETIFNLFKKGTVTKPILIGQIMESYPQRRFVLVGDSGEQDPEVYAAIKQRYPDRIVHIYIRNVTDAKPTDARFRSAFDQIDASDWTLFTDARSLSLSEELLRGDRD